MIKIDSVVVLSTYFGNRSKYPMDGNATLYVLYDFLNYYRTFDFGVECDIIVVNHDVTTFLDFEKLISKERQEFYIKSKELLNNFNGIKLLHGGEIKIIHRDWNNGIGMGVASFNFAYEKFRHRYNYWFLNEDDNKLIIPGQFKELINKLNKNDKISYCSWFKSTCLCVTSTYYLDIMYNKLGHLLGSYTPLSINAQINSIEKMNYAEQHIEEIQSKRRNEGDTAANGWMSFWNNVGYIGEGGPSSGFFANRTSHMENKNQTPRIIINEKDELTINYGEKIEKIEKWIK